MCFKRCKDNVFQAACRDRLRLSRDRALHNFIRQMRETDASSIFAAWLCYFYAKVARISVGASVRLVPLFIKRVKFTVRPVKNLAEKV